MGRFALCALLAALACSSATEPEAPAALRYVAERVYQEPVIRGSDVDAAGIGEYPQRRNYRGHAMFPSVIAVPDWVPPEDRADPRAKFYLYFAAHHGPTINLAWADRIDAPRWTLFNTTTEPADNVPGRGVFDLDLGEEAHLDLAPGVYLHNHVSSPEIVVDQANRRFLLTLHARYQDGQDSFLATSADGLNFNPPELGGQAGHGPAPAVFSRTTYLRVFELGGELLAIGRSGRFSRPRNPSAPWTAAADQGLEPMWESSETCPISREALKKGVAEGVDEGDMFRHGSVLVRDGRLIDLFYSRGLDGDNEHLLHATLDASAEDWETWDVVAEPQTLLQPELDWEQPEIHNSFVYRSGGELYLFYSAGPSGEDSIGLAKLRSVQQ